MRFVTSTSTSIDLTQSLLVSNTLCSEVVRWKVPMHILWWSNLYNSLNHKFVLSRMCMVTTCVKKTECTQWLNLLITTAHKMCLGVTNLLQSAVVNKYDAVSMVTLYCCMVVNSPIRLVSWSAADGGIEVVSS